MATPATAPEVKRGNDGKARDAKTQREYYEQMKTSLWTERSSYDAHWRMLGDYILPRRTRFTVTDKNRGDRRNQNIIDGTATRAARTLRSGMHAGMSSPARPWMKLTVTDPELSQFPPVRQWLHTVTARMRALFVRSNLYNVLPIIYGDMGVFATAAMSVLEDDQDLVRFYAYPIGSYALGYSQRQSLDTFVREYTLSVSQLVEEFGRENVSQTARNLWDRRNYMAPVEVCWIVTPNRDYDEQRVGVAGQPYVSNWFEKGAEDGKVLRESGFFEMPILAPRWDVTAEDSYGSDCPGMTALGDIRQLQTMQRRKGQAIEKMINPSLQAPTHMRNQKISLLPGDINYIDATQQGQGLRPVHEVQLGVAEITADIQDIRAGINEAFFTDLFLMMTMSDRRGATGDMTAREVDERHEEKLLALGPVLERANDELFDPLVDRVYSIMYRAGLIPEPPEEMEGVDLKVDYVSILAQAQKLLGVGGTDRFVASVLPLTEVYPGAKHKINYMHIIDDYADMLDVDPESVVPTEQAEQMMAQEQQMAAQQMAAQNADTMASAAQKLGSTPMAEDTALTRMFEGGGQPLQSENQAPVEGVVPA